jgi:hypothetical protein
MYQETREELKVDKMLSFGEFVIVTYKGSFFLDIFKKRGELAEMHDVSKACYSTKISLKSIS